MSVTPESIKAMIERERPEDGDPQKHLEALAFIAVDNQLLASTWSAQLEAAESKLEKIRAVFADDDFVPEEEALQVLDILEGKL